MRKLLAVISLVVSMLAVSGCGVTNWEGDWELNAKLTWSEGTKWVFKDEPTSITKQSGNGEYLVSIEEFCEEIEGISHDGSSMELKKQECLRSGDVKLSLASGTIDSDGNITAHFLIQYIQSGKTIFEGDMKGKLTRVTSKK